MTAGCHQHRTPAGGRSRCLRPIYIPQHQDRGEQGVGETALTDEALEYDPKHLRPNFTDLHGHHSIQASRGSHMPKG